MIGAVGHFSPVYLSSPSTHSPQQTGHLIPGRKTVRKASRSEFENLSASEWPPPYVEVSWLVLPSFASLPCVYTGALAS